MEKRTNPGKRLKIWVTGLVLLSILITCIPPFQLNASAAELDREDTIKALDALLSGIALDSNSNLPEKPSAWSNEDIAEVIWRKFYMESDLNYQKKLGIKKMDASDYTGEGYFDYKYDYALVNRLTMDAYGVELPGGIDIGVFQVDGAYVYHMLTDANPFVMQVQEIKQLGNKVAAVGMVYRTNHMNEFATYFAAEFKINPSSVYGFTLTSLKTIDANQNFRNITASASSEFPERDYVYVAQWAVDGDIETPWVENAAGVGINEWIRLETKNGEKKEISALEIYGGYHRAELLTMNARPKRIRIECEGGFSQEASLLGPQMFVVLDESVTTSWIKITILEVEQGTHYEDTCIAEINFYGIDSEKYFAENVQETAEIAVYSDYGNLHIRNDNVITVCAGVFEEGVQQQDLSGLAFSVEDSSVLEVISVQKEGKLLCLRLRSLRTGKTNVIFSDTKTGAIKTVPITVFDDSCLSYTLGTVPAQNTEDYPANIYNANGLYVDRYSYTANADKTATVSFDVYNAAYTYAVVEVFDAEGNLDRAVLIDKMRNSSAGITEATWDDIGFLMQQWRGGNSGGYRQEGSYSKKTSVSVTIPKNGYIKISNDPANSFAVGMVNSVDILMSLAKLMDKAKDYDVNSYEFSKKIASKLANDQAFAKFSRDGSGFANKLLENTGKDQSFSSSAMGDFTDAVAENMIALNLEGLVLSAAAEFGYDLGADASLSFAEPIGTVLKGMSAIGDIANTVSQFDHLTGSAGVGAVVIQNQGGGIRSCQQIKVESETDFSSEVALHIFSTSLDAAVLDILEKADLELHQAVTKGLTHTYSISLVKNGKQMQPDSSVKVYIPVSEELKALAHAGKANVYRVEEHGTMTLVDAKLEDGYFVFEADHLGLYTLVGYRKQETGSSGADVTPTRPSGNVSPDDGTSDPAEVPVVLLIAVSLLVLAGVAAAVVLVVQNKKKSMNMDME